MCNKKEKKSYNLLLKTMYTDLIPERLRLMYNLFFFFPLFKLLILSNSWQQRHQSIQKQVNYAKMKNQWMKTNTVVSVLQQMFAPQIAKMLSLGSIISDYRVP